MPLMVVAPGDAAGTFRQHYFDSRGVEREFAMTIDEREWRVERRWRESPSFFDQRFVGRFADGGDRSTLAGRRPTTARTGNSTSSSPTGGRASVMAR